LSIFQDTLVIPGLVGFLYLIICFRFLGEKSGVGRVVLAGIVGRFSKKMPYSGVRFFADLNCVVQYLLSVFSLSLRRIKILLFSITHLISVGESLRT